MLFVVYIVFSGSFTIFDIVTGIIVAVVGGLLTANLLVRDVKKSLNPLRLVWLIIYALLYLSIIEFKAHFDVAKRILHPKIPINPGIVRVPYHVETDYAKVTIANSITNTPGTVVVDLDEDRRYYYVHWINVKAPDEKTTYENIVKTFEKYAKKIFD